MPDDLLIAIPEWNEVSRSDAVNIPGYPWGNGVEDDSQFIGGDGPLPCNPAVPGRRPRKWPDNLDYRSPGFLPWSQSTATPSPAAYKGVFSIFPGGSPWPDPTDHGKTVYLVPRCDPSTAVQDCTWDVVGLSGGSIWLRTVVTDFFGDPVSFYPGHLSFMSFANFTGPDDPATYASDNEQFNTSLSYEGPFKFFGPLFTRDMQEADPLADRCIDTILGANLHIQDLTGGWAHLNGTNVAFVEVFRNQDLVQFEYDALIDDGAGCVGFIDAEVRFIDDLLPSMKRGVRAFGRFKIRDTGPPDFGAFQEWSLEAAAECAVLPTWEPVYDIRLPPSGTTCGNWIPDVWPAFVSIFT